MKSMICETSHQPDEIHHDRSKNKQWFKFRQYKTSIGVTGRSRVDCSWLQVTSKKNGYIKSAYPIANPKGIGEKINITYTSK